MKKTKKILCLLLVFALTFGCMSGMAFAMTWGTKPADGVTEDQPFASGTGGSTNFRIPCLVALDDGTIVAACDARWNHSSDACGLDTIVSRSTDYGKTWNYTFANYLGDNGNTFSYDSTAFIDPAIATDGETVWMIADIYPAGVAINTVPSTHNARPGHTGYDENHNLVLAKTTDTVNGLSATNDRIAQPFDYHLEKIEGAADDAESYYNLIDADGNVVEGYTIDAFFNIKGDGVDTNLFCGDSPYFPYPTDFLYMTSSKDGGATWSIPTLIDVKRADEQTLLVGPGRGIVTSEGRIVFTAYDFTYGDDKSCAIYSDDGGKTWTRGEDVAAWSSESVVTEADGKLYLFTRHGNAYYVSEDWGETWGPQRSTGLTYNSNCQVTAITYSEKIDGKTAILFAAPSSTSSRANGKIFVGLVQEDTTIEWIEEFNVCEGGAAYAYSCLAELANGDIGLLWEHQGAGIRYDSYSMDEILGYVKNITIDQEEQYVEEREATAAAEITQAPDEAIATVTSEYIVEEATTLLYDHASNTASSLSSFSTTANVANSLEKAELVLTNVEGNVYKAYNPSTGKYAYKASTGASGAYVNLADSADDAAYQLVLEPTTADDGSVTYKMYRASGNDRYTIFYNTNMDFNTNSGYNAAWTGPGSSGDYEMVLLEKQESVSDADIIPGYTRAAEITSGNTYLISYIWESTDDMDGSVFLLDPTGTSTGGQTKLVGDTVTVAKNVVTITGIAPGETTAVVGDVTYNITVTDPTKSPSYAGNDLPTEGMVATAGSLEPSEGSLEALFDGDADSFYHSNWSGTRPTEEDFWITIELPEATGVSGLRYLPRQSSANGRILQYVISYSLDGETWTEIASGKWEDDTSWKLAKFDENVNAKYVKIFATDSKADSSGRHLTAAELRVVKATGEITPPAEEADRTALEAALAEAAALNADDYTEESWNELQTVIAALEYLPEDASQQVIDNATKEITDAIAALVEKEEPIVPPVEEDEVVRLFGQGRYETGYAVADELKEVLGVEKFEAVVVATGTNFADALAGSYLAVEKDAPILLTNGKEANVAQLHDYIKANVVENGTVYILGGEGAVPETVDAIEGYEVVRLFGDSRYDTNLEILKEAGVAGDSIIVATGKTFADSLSASAAKLPILLVKPNGTLNDAQKAVLEGMKNIYIVGGDGAVSASYAEELAAFGEVTRVFGQSRYDTSVEVAKTFCDDVDKAVVASGKNFPDGLCGGPLAAALDAPLILTKDGGTDAAAGYVADNGIASGYVLGGDGALTDDTVVAVFGLESAAEIK